MATVGSSRSSTRGYTSPRPPAPSTAPTRYGPGRAPRVRSTRRDYRRRPLRSRAILWRMTHRYNAVPPLAAALAVVLLAPLPAQTPSAKAFTGARVIDGTDRPP